MQADDRVDTLTEELARLRARHRRLSWIAALTLVVAYAALVTAVAVFVRTPSSGGVRILDARELVLRDDQGTVRAALTLESDGSPTLDLYDRDGKDRARLAVRADGFPGLHLYDENGRARAALFDSSGFAALGFQGGDGRPRALLSVFADGSATFNLFDKDGKGVFQAPGPDARQVAGD